jgi:hypothetical protein
MKFKVDPRRTVLKILISAGLLIAAIVLTVQMIQQARENQEMKIDLAEINHIRYGLLNADEWAERVSLIIGKKIVDFDLSPGNRDELRKSLEVILQRLLDDLEILIEERTSGQFSGLKKIIAGMVLDVDQLRDSVPSFSDRILDELNQPGTKQSIQNYLSDKLGDLSSSTYSLDSMEVLKQLLVKYDCSDKSVCREQLRAEIDQETGVINSRVVLILFFVLLIFLLNTITRSAPDRLQSALLILSSLCLLVGGITTPMIDLEARIDTLMFKLIGEDVVFRDNIIFFQSKSITDIVGILIREGSLQMIFVGVLVFTFSIVFPFSKLISSFLYSLHLDRLNEHWAIRFFVIKSGKWSMADVMVVAIFMAYIGFNGLVSSQLDDLSRSADPVEIFTTNGTQLLGGFYLFLCFCISSLVLSEILTRKVTHIKT